MFQYDLIMMLHIYNYNIVANSLHINDLVNPHKNRSVMSNGRSRGLEAELTRTFKFCTLAHWLIQLAVGRQDLIQNTVI